MKDMRILSSVEVAVFDPLWAVTFEERVWLVRRTQ